MSDSELAQAIECIEVNSTTTSLVQVNNRQQLETSFVNTDTSPARRSDSGSRGITTITQKREAVLAARPHNESEASIAPGASSSQHDGLGSDPVQVDDNQEPNVPQIEEETLTTTGGGQIEIQGNQEASVAMDVDTSSRRSNPAQYDVSRVLDEFDAPLMARHTMPSAPRFVSSPGPVTRRDTTRTGAKLEQRARRRGWKSLNRWVIPGFFRHWELISSVDARGRDTKVGDFLGGRASPADIKCYDFVRHLNIPVKDTLRETRCFVMPMLFERLDRMSLKGISLIHDNPSLTTFDVVWARNREEYAYCVWASSAACRALEDRVSELIKSSPSSVPRVAHAVLSWRNRLLLHSAVPWERYPKDIVGEGDIAESQLRSPECHPVAPTPAHYGRYGTIIIRPSLIDNFGNFTGYCVLPTSLRNELENYVPLAWRRFARTRRHRFERLIAEHQCEVELYQNHAVASRYLDLPSWWSSVEVPYGFYNLIPFLVIYRSTVLVHNYPFADVFLRSEWALSVAVHLMYEARSGKLWWIPFEVRQDIIRLQLTDSSSVNDPAEAEARRQLAQLIGYVNSLAWSRIPRDGSLTGYPDMGTFELSGGIDPDRINGITPVHRGADWVIFDAEEWCLHLPDEYFVPYIDEESHQYNPEEPRRDRIRFYGESTPGVGMNVAREDEDDPVLREWRGQQLSRLRESDSALAIHLERNVPHSTPRNTTAPRLARPIERSRESARQERSASLLAYLEREGITDVQSFIASQHRNDGASPSNV